MKKVTVVFFSVILMFSVAMMTSCNTRKNKVKAYVEAINYEHQRVVNRMDALERALEAYIPQIMDNAYADVLNQLDSSEMVVRNLKPVNPETSLKDEAMLLFDTYRLLIKNEYSDIIKRQKKPAGTFTITDEFLVENLGKLVSNQRRKAKAKFEQEAARILTLYEIPFEPVKEEIPGTNSAKTTESKAPGQ